MSEHPNIAIVRDSYEALANGDLDLIRDRLLADGVVFHVPGRGPLAGEHRGKDQVLRYLSDLAERTDGAMRLEPDVVLSNDEYTAAMVHVKGGRNGTSLDERGVHMFRITDGKISERWSFPHDSYVIDEYLT